MRTVAFICFFAVVGISILVAADREGTVDDNRVVLSCQRSDTKEMIEVRFGDITFVTTELSFVHGDGSRTDVRAKDGVVKLQNGDTKISGKQISSSCRGGIFGRRGQAAGILKTIIQEETKK